MKKLVSLILALAMVFAMTICVSAQADYTPAELEALEAKATKKTGTLTINGATAGTTYTLYRILNIEKAVNDKENVYLLNEKWGNFMNGYSGITVSNGYVKAFPLAGDQPGREAQAQALAKAVVEHARANNIGHDGQSKMTISGDYTSSTPRQYGYYVLASDRTGDDVQYTVFELNAETVSISEKNKPVVGMDKYVQEDSLSSNMEKNYGWGESNSAEIAQPVKFKIELRLAPGTDTYILEDTMPKFRKLENFKVEYSGGVIETADYTHAVTDDENGLSFTFQLTDNFRKLVEEGDTLTISYSAMLRYTAGIGADNKNTNTAILTYGNGKTITDSTYTTTHKMKISKVDENNEPLKDAKFELRHDGEPLKFIVTGTNEYTIADPKNHQESEMTTEIITSGNCEFTICGLDTTSGPADAYILKETFAPDPYIKMEDRAIEIIENDDHQHDITVVNLPGVVMPETGGMGTTLFYILGAVLACGAAVLLVFKKRMSAN